MMMSLKARIPVTKRKYKTAKNVRRRIRRSRTLRKHLLRRKRSRSKSRVKRRKSPPQTLRRLRRNAKIEPRSC